jgi:hypothetical protein
MTNRIRPLPNSAPERPEEEDFTSDYRDDDFDPRITNEFAVGGYRIGHTTVPESIQ